MRKIYFYLVAVIAFLSFSTNVMAEGKTAYAAYFEETSTKYYGAIVSFDLTNPAGGLTEILKQEEDQLISAATLAGNTYYAMCKDEATAQATKFSIFNFEQKTIKELGKATTLFDMTYDATAKVMYGIDTDNTNSTLYTIDVKNGTLTPFTTFNDIAMQGIAADGKGNLYAVANNKGGEGVLCTISIAEKTFHEVGKLNLNLLSYEQGAQSLEFDGDVLYWLGTAYVENGAPGYFLATINTQNGNANRIGNFNRHLVGLCFSLANGDGGSGTTPDPDPEPTDYTKVTTIQTFGDTMGDQEGKLTKVETFFYDADNTLMRSIKQGVMLTGEWQPTEYRTYIYNDKKQLEKQYYRQYGQYDGNDMAWGKEKGIETYQYDDNGKLIQKDGENGKFTYEWNGDNLIKETKYSGNTGSFISSITYSDFLADAVNCPQTVTGDGAYDTYKYTATITYDNNHNKISYIAKNTDGSIKEKEEWKYNADGQLIEDTRYTVKNNEFFPKSRVVYTINGNETKIENQDYSEQTNDQGEKEWIWSSMPIYTVSITSQYYETLAPSNLEVTKVENEVNTVLLTFDIPQVLSIEYPAWDVYRDGLKIGRATLDTQLGKYVYTDEMVKNGIYDYFVQTVNAENENAVEGYNISNVVSYDLYTELPPVTNIRYISHEKRKQGTYNVYDVTIGWDVPETDLPIKGYNIFLDKFTLPQVTVTTNEDGTLPNSAVIKEFSATDDASLKHNVTIETIYAIGKIKTEPTEIDLTNYVSIENNTMQDRIQVYGDMILINGEYTSLDIIGTNGMLINHYTDMPSIDTTSLPQGIYILRIEYNGDIHTMKLIKR